MENKIIIIIMENNKINIAEILKDCPQGMKLYSPIFGDVYLNKIRQHLAIVVTTDKEQGIFKEEFLYDGRYGMNGERMLFPSKDQRDWNKFQRPFQDGDIVAYDNDEFGNVELFIFKEYKRNNNTVCYLFLDSSGELHNITTTYMINRLATEKEKEKLFKAIKDNGYKWNVETKTLEKLIEPKFKVGDRVRHKTTRKQITITKIHQDCYEYGGRYILTFENQDEYELVPNKAEHLQPYKEETMKETNKAIFEGNAHCCDIMNDIIKDNIEERKYAELRMPLDDDDKLSTEATIDGNKITPPENYLIGKITKVDNGMLVEFVKKKPQYPKTYEECCKVLGIDTQFCMKYLPHGTLSYKDILIYNLQELLICRDAYWKIIGDWKPEFRFGKKKYCIMTKDNKVIDATVEETNRILVFPIEEMRDVFYDNFEELINECKELL